MTSAKTSFPVKVTCFGTGTCSNVLAGDTIPPTPDMSVGVHSGFGRNIILCSSLRGPQGGPVPFHIFPHLIYIVHSSSFSKTLRQKVFESVNRGLISALDDSQSGSLKLWGARRKQARAQTSGVHREPQSPFRLEPAPWSHLLSLPEMLRNQTSASHAARTEVLTCKSEPFKEQGDSSRKYSCLGLDKHLPKMGHLETELQSLKQKEEQG